MYVVKVQYTDFKVFIGLFGGAVQVVTQQLVCSFFERRRLVVLSETKHPPI